MSRAPFDTNRHARLVPLDEVLDAVADLLGEDGFRSPQQAIDVKVGMALSSPLLRLGLLAHWLSVDAQSLEDACRERPALARFVAAGSVNPIVDIWVYQQIAPRIDMAEVEFAELATAIEDELAASGRRFVAAANEDPANARPAANSDWADKTLVDASPSPPWGTPFSDDDVEHASGRTGRQHRVQDGPRALVVWPWGESLPIAEALRIGRDPAFCAQAPRLDGDRWISRRHLLLEPMAGGVLVRDMGSSNGSVVDGVRIGRGHARLVDGDCTVHLGPNFAFKIVFFPGFVERGSA